MVPFPAPLAPLVMEIQEALLIAVQDTVADGAVTATEPVAAAAVWLAEAGFIENDAMPRPA
jgi:hypothetical protein